MLSPENRILCNCFVDLLYKYVKICGYSGYDPYDGLNSRLLKATPFFHFVFVRLMWIQFFKHCPINLRSIVDIPPEFNPKAGALFLLGYINLLQAEDNESYRKECQTLFTRIKECCIYREKGVAWGYNFPWQAKAFYVPVGTPNVVTSVYVGHALMDYAEMFNSQEARDMVAGVKDFILNEMVIWNNEKELCFAYIPQKTTEVHNANLLTAAFLSRYCTLDLQAALAEMIRKACRFSIKDVSAEGFWPYGTESHHRWMDNFHTAFNLEALMMIREKLRTNEYDAMIRKVFVYYRKNIFLPDGTPKYYNHKVYPIDIHTIAEAIVFLSKVAVDKSGLFTEEERTDVRTLLEAIVTLAIKQFWDKRGFFYYQKNKYFTNKIPYMRWAQAWMFYALSCFDRAGRSDPSYTQ